MTILTVKNMVHGHMKLNEALVIGIEEWNDLHFNHHHYLLLNVKNKMNVVNYILLGKRLW